MKIGSIAFDLQGQTLIALATLDGWKCSKRKSVADFLNARFPIEGGGGMSVGIISIKRAAKFFKGKASVVRRSDDGDGSKVY